MRYRGLLMILFLTTTVIPQVGKADTALDIIGVEKSVNDMSHQAQQTGDHIAEAFAKQILKAIEEWKKANASLIDQGFDRLDDASKRMWREVNDTTVKLEKGEKVTFVDLQRGIAAAGDAIANVPGGWADPQVALSYPSVVLPEGEKLVTFHIVGARIADGQPILTYQGHQVDLKFVSDNELTADIPRASLPRENSNRSSTSLSLDYKVSASKWYNPFTWWSTEARHRDIMVSVLPTTPGNIEVVSNLRTEGWETKVLDPVVLSGHGMDHDGDMYPYQIPLLEREAGWVLDKTGQKSAQWDDNGGSGEGGSHCNGYDENSFTDSGFNFSVYHGHKTDWAGHKSDVSQSCRVWVHLKRRKDEDKSNTQSSDLKWQKDTDVLIAANATKYTVHYSLFTGVSYSFANDEQVPYDLFQIFRDKDTVKFRPRPQMDF